MKNIELIVLAAVVFYVLSQQQKKTVVPQPKPSSFTDDLAKDVYAVAGLFSKVFGDKGSTQTNVGGAPAGTFATTSADGTSAGDSNDYLLTNMDGSPA
jgi:hypothetical protein